MKTRLAIIAIVAMIGVAHADEPITCWGSDSHLHPCTQEQRDAQDAVHDAKLQEIYNYREDATFRRVRRPQPPHRSS